MSRPTRCRRCAVVFVTDRVAALIGPWRLCSHCRPPLPPTGGVPAVDDGRHRPWPPDAAR